MGAGSLGDRRWGGGVGGWGGMLLSVYGGLCDVLVFHVSVVTVLLGGLVGMPHCVRWGGVCNQSWCLVMYWVVGEDIQG